MQLRADTTYKLLPGTSVSLRVPPVVMPGGNDFPKQSLKIKILPFHY